MKKKRKWIKITLTVLTTLTIFYLVIGLVFYHFALNANATQSREIGEKQYVPSPSIEASREQTERKKDRDFIKSVQPENLTLTSHDELKLQGYIFEQPNITNEWIFAVHGYTGSVRQMTRWNRQMYELGYNVFAPDLRGHGESDGDYYGMGWLDQQDLHDWLGVLIDRYPNAKITLYGVSMGASAVLNLAGDELPAQVDSVIADSGFTSVATIFETQLHSVLNLPSFPIMNAANTVAQMRIGLNFYEASTVNKIKNSHLPTFFIHGGDDTFVPVDNVYALAAATSAEHDVWVVKDANHGEAVKLEPDQYKQKLHSFIEKHRN